MRLGVCSDRVPESPSATFAALQEYHINFVSVAVDTRAETIDGDMAKMLSLAALCDATDIQIHIIVDPIYGFESTHPETEAWWQRIIAAMEMMRVHPSMRYFGMYSPEHYASDLPEGSTYWHDLLTQTIVDTAFTRISQEAIARGLTPIHWGLNFAGFNINAYAHYWAGGYPDPYGGGIYTETPPANWQYQWVIDDMRNTYPKSPQFYFTGMWSEETTLGTAEGAGWTYRNTMWQLTSVRDAGVPLDTVVFMAWLDGLLVPAWFPDGSGNWVQRENTEFQRALRDFAAPTPTAPFPAKVGINTDHNPVDYSNIFLKAKSFGVKLLSFVIDPRMDYYLDFITNIDALATLCDAEPDMAIHVIFNPQYAFESPYPSTEQWWNQVVITSMELLKLHRSVRYMGMYGDEHYAIQLPEGRTYWLGQLTQTILDNAFARFNAEATNRGYIPMHWSKNRFGGLWPANPDTFFYTGSYPDPNAGWLWSSTPPLEWQYQWLLNDMINKGATSRVFFFTGMWSGETSYGTLDGAGWTYRNTAWLLQSAIDCGAPPQYVVFEGWIEVLLFENTEFQRALTDYLLPLPSTGTLTVDTSPIKGEVIIDNLSQGLAPVTVPLAPGTYHVTFGTVAGYTTPPEQIVTVLSNQLTTVFGTYIPLAPTQGTLEVMTTPVAGNVFVNNGFIGVAPVTVSLNVGEYTVSFGAVQGYAPPLPIGVTITENHISSVTGVYTEIPPLTGVVVVDTAPIKSNVYLDNVFRGLAPLTLELELGTYVISFEAIEGYVTPPPRTITVTDGSSQTILGQYRTPGGGFPLIAPVIGLLALVSVFIVRRR